MVGAAGVNALARLAETILLARYLSPAHFGELVLIIAYPEAVQQLLGFRVPEAMTRYLGEFITRGRREEAVALLKLLWLLDVAVSLLAFLLVALTAGFAAHHLLHDRDLASLMVIYALGTLFASLDTASPTILRVLDRFPLSFTAASTLALTRLGLIVMMVVLGAGLKGLVWATVGASAISTVVAAALALIALGPMVWRERRAPITTLRGRLKEIGKFLVNTNLAGSIRLASSKLDTLVIGLLTGPTTVSIYRVAVQLGSAPLNVSDPLLVAYYPSFVRLHTVGRFREVLSLGRRTTVILATVAVPVGALLAYKSELVIDLTVGAKYHKAALPFVVLLLSVIPVVVFFWTRAAILTLGRADIVLRIVAIAAGVQLALLFVLVPLLGATGGALSLATMNVMVVALQLAYLYRGRSRWAAPPPADSARK
jgi:O-antigen/teichoic acid export membrane protein